MEKNLNELKYFFFDLDKTIWNWNDTIIGVEDVIDSLRESGKKVYFHTDNSLLSRKEYAKKLTGMGIPAGEEDVITSSYVAAKYLARKNINEVYVIGESGLIDELEKEDIQISKNAEVVVAGFDRQFNYEKLRRAGRILQNGGQLLTLSSEKTFRTTKAEQPHQGPTNLALAEFGEAKNLGKPSEEFRNQFKEYFSYLVNNSLFVGDRFEDIETGNRLGMKTAAVMSGDITQDRLKKAEDIQKPDYGLSSLNRLRRRIL